jgi:hypothetical protein
MENETLQAGLIDKEVSLQRNRAVRNWLVGTVGIENNNVRNFKAYEECRGRLSY